MQLKPFFRHLRGLLNFEIVFDAKFSAQAKNEFLAAQEIPDSFKMVEFTDRARVRFEKR